MNKEELLKDAKIIEKFESKIGKSFPTEALRLSLLEIFVEGYIFGWDCGESG